MVKKLLFAACLVVFAATAYTQGTVVWEENFDGGSGLPAGWTQTSSATDGGWKVGTTSALSSQYFPVPSRAGNILGTNDDACNCNKANEIVKFPPIDLTSQTDIRMLFDLFFIKGSYNGKVETLKLLVTVDGGTTWDELVNFTGASGWRSPYMVDITPYAGKPNVQFAFRYDDAADWLYGAMVDNIRIVIPDDVLKARVASVTTGKNIDAIPLVRAGYAKLLVGDEVTVRMTVNNDGFPAITSFDLLATRGTDTIQNTVTGQNITLGQSRTYTFALPVKLGANDFNVTISNVNGVGDDDAADNTGSASIEGVEVQPGRKVVVEEGTGTWCTWCPRGAVMMDYIAQNYDGVAVPIAVHNSTSDPMRVATYDAGMLTLIGGFPSGVVERETDIDPLDFEKSLIEHLTWPAQILVSQDVQWDAATRKVTVTSSLNFQEEMNGDYRIAVVYTEEGVTGTTSGYNQVNAYSGGGQGPMGGFESLPSPVPAAQMTYNHVARAIVGGFKGAANSVPASNPAGSVMSYTSSYTVPAAYNIDNMKVATLVIDQATGYIINAEETAIPFISTSAPTLEEVGVSVSIAPNPVVDEATLTVKVNETADVQIRIVDAFGRIVSERIYANVSGKQFLPFRAGNLANGMYTLVATAKGQSVSKPFVITH